MTSLALRPTRPILIGLIYFAAAAATIATTRFGGGVAFLWIANAFLVAELKLSPRSTWPGSLAACAVASFAATTLFGVGLVGAPALALINVGEAVIGLLLLQRLSPRSRPLETIAGVFIFIFSVAIVAPAVTAPLGAGAVMLAAGLPDSVFLTNALRWYAGHALGALTFMPLFVFILSGDAEKWARSVTVAGAIEAAVIMIGVLATAIVVFSQSQLPLLFLPTLPLIVALFRIGESGGALGVVIIALVGVYFTAEGQGPIELAGGSGNRMQFLQFYLAVLVLISLPVAADLTRRNAHYDRLRDSEARYRLLAENSTDVVLNLDVDGRIRFISKSIEGLGGYRPADLIGRKASELVHPEDNGAVVAAYAAAFAYPGQLQIVEHRAVTDDGSIVWVEAHTQAIVDEAGQPQGLVSAVRDIGHRRGREQELVRQASTDPLTGLLNRRGFFGGLDSLLRNQLEAQRCCFALFDIDHFKRVNDSHGHSAGDQVLEEFARIARLVVRDDDLVGRLGGEEFGILMRGASFDHAVMVCERLRTTFAEQSVRSPSGSPIWVTVSAGVVPLGPKMTREQLYRRADEALYRAKAGGRNQIGLAA